jgi:hypothetical protein
VSDGLLPGMEEGRRQAWLAALGIPLWSSRQDLPGAKTSAGLEFVDFSQEPVFSEEPALPEQHEAAAEALAPTIVEPASPAVLTPAVKAAPFEAPSFAAPSFETPPLATPSRAANQGAQASTVSPSAAKPATTNPDYPRFACRVELLAPGWLGVIALDDAPDLSAQEYRLLGNLVQALGGDGAAAGAREHFRWPLSPNPAIPRDAGAAREALAAFLGRRRVSPDGNMRWLVLGETLAVYVRTALPQHQVIAAPMLRELLENPAAKRSLWQALHG